MAPAFVKGLPTPCPRRDRPGNVENLTLTRSDLAYLGLQSSQAHGAGIRQAANVFLTAHDRILGGRRNVICEPLL